MLSSQASRSRSRTPDAPLLPATDNQLSGRRLSDSPGLIDNHSGELRLHAHAGSESVVDESYTTEELGTFYQDLQIVMKDAVGDAVGNMSISPTSRDIVLAARKGLFIIDLDNPLAVPRFLPQGGTWNVADVQWNPHLSHQQYVVSTSNEKLLIWNLHMSGKTAIEHILHQHYRAITDINWHNSHPDLIASTGIDSWIWVWDIRTPRKASIGLCAFNPGATQVKWNRVDEHILASSHYDNVVVWDKRKGSLPLMSYRAHSAKIYGIDWGTACSPLTLVTCSLDKTIRSWDLRDPDAICLQSRTTIPPEPINTIHTHYPVWRARNTPFGKGVLALPQRSETTLEMWKWPSKETGRPLELVTKFEGHSDLIKEYVWRAQGGLGAAADEFQLITWSKDRTLRLWPIDMDVMDKMGVDENTSEEYAVSPLRRGRSASTRSINLASFRDPPQPPVSDVLMTFPPLLPPIGPRSILREVRAYGPAHANPVLLANYEEATARTKGIAQPKASSSTRVPKPGRTMTKGGKGSSRSTMDPITWLSSVRVREKKGGGSSGGESVDREFQHSGSRSRDRSRLRSSSIPEDSLLSSGRPSSSAGYREGAVDDHQRLKAEITQVFSDLQRENVALEYVDIIIARTCTVGLQGPWGESSGNHMSGVFLRVTFTFPSTYPSSRLPSADPNIEIERTPLIPPAVRAYLLRKLRTIRSNRPCLRDCLLYLLGLSPYGKTTIQDDSSDDESTIANARREKRALHLARGNQIPQFRTVLGMLGPNGEIVCHKYSARRLFTGPFSRKASPSSASHSEAVPAVRTLQSPGILTESILRFSNLACDRSQSVSIDANGDVLRVMDLIDWKKRHGHLARPSHSADRHLAGSLPATAVNDKSVLYVRDISHLVVPERVLARDYQVCTKSPVLVCEQNAAAARLHGRYDHERIFQMLRLLVSVENANGVSNVYQGIACDYQPVAPLLIESLYNELSSQKDIQLLALVAAILIEAGVRSMSHDSSQRPLPKEKVPKLSNDMQHPVPLQPLGSSTPQLVDRSAVSTFTKGSWSSILGNGGIKLLRSNSASGVDTPQSNERPSINGASASTLFNSETSSHPFPHPVQPLLMHSHPTFSQVLTSKASLPLKAKLYVDLDTSTISEISPSCQRLLTNKIVSHCVPHIKAYSEMLLQWNLPYQRAEILKCLHSKVYHDPWMQMSGLELVDLCSFCSAPFGRGARYCLDCFNAARIVCVVCRLPIRGLSHTCLTCRHAMHLSCYRSCLLSTCPSGCGCTCNPLPSNY